MRLMRHQLVLGQLLDVVQTGFVGAVEHLHDLVVGLAAAWLVVERALPDDLGATALGLWSRA